MYKRQACDLAPYSSIAVYADQAAKVVCDERYWVAARSGPGTEYELCLLYTSCEAQRWSTFTSTERTLTPMYSFTMNSRAFPAPLSCWCPNWSHAAFDDVMYEPVSYTHLDVYKRQTLAGTQRI